MEKLVEEDPVRRNRRVNVVCWAQISVDLWIVGRWMRKNSGEETVVG